MCLVLTRAPEHPKLQGVYWMPHELYDAHDSKDHPILVVSNDGLRRRANIITRTSSYRPERKNDTVAHQARPDLGLQLLGWWDPHHRHSVPWTHFEDPAVKFMGVLEDPVWIRVQEKLRERRETR